MNYSHLIFPCLRNTRYVHFLYFAPPPPPHLLLTGFHQRNNSFREHNTLFSEHMRPSSYNTTRPTRNTADPYFTMTELSPINTTTTIIFLMVRLWTFLQMVFSTVFCFSQRSKNLLGKTPTHKVVRKYLTDLTKSVVLILMLNMQICSCPHILKIWFLYVVWWAHEMSIKYKSSPGFTWVFP